MSPSSQNNLILTAIYAVFFFYGASQVIKYEGNATYYLFSLLFVILVSFCTCLRHQETQFANQRIIKGAVYSTRKLKGAGWCILNLIAIYFVLAVGFYLAFYGLYYSGQWDLIDPVLFQ